MTLNIPAPTKTFKRTTYTRIKAGTPTIIQILSEDAVVVGKHWIADGTGYRFSLRCPGAEACPICQRNRQVNFNREHPDFHPLSRRYRLNVLNLTPVKRCPSCNALYPAESELLTCTADGCGASLEGVEATPMNEVQILERGRTLMEQFKAFETVPHAITGEKMPVQAYPFMLIATGSGKEMKITLQQQAPREITEDYELFDLEAEGLMLSTEEIEHIIEGGSFKDVIAARRATQETTETKEEIPF